MSYVQRLQTLAKINGVSINYCKEKSEPWQADMSERMLYLGQPEECEEWYFRGLHELGHVVCDHRKSEQDVFAEEILDIVTPNVLENEAEAWLWAIDHAGERPNRQALKVLLRCFATYLRGFHGRPGPRSRALAAAVADAAR